MSKLQSGSIETSSGRTEYLEQGRGAPLMLLHGIGSSAHSFAALMDLLSNQFRVLAWNAPGYGNSTPVTASAPSARDYGVRLIELTRALEVSEALLFGHSLGALMASAAVAIEPSLARALILADPAQGYGRAPAEQRQQKLKSRLDAFEQLGPDAFAAARAPGLLSAAATEAQLALVINIMAKLNPAGYHQAAQMLAFGDLAGELAAWTGPTLVMCGTQDTITPPAAARALAAALASARYLEIPGAGHAGYVEQPAAFANAVAGFASEIRSRADGQDT